MRNKSRIFNKAISPIVVSNRINSEKDNKKVKNLFSYFLNPRLPKKKICIYVRRSINYPWHYWCSCFNYNPDTFTKVV